MNTVSHKTLKLTLRSQLIGMATIDPRYWVCVEALNYAEGVHTGERKGGAPEFYHMLSILGSLMDKHHSLTNPFLIYAAALLHDSYEDYPDLEAEIRSIFPEVFPYILRLSKVRNGVKIPYDKYFDEIARCPVCSIVKGEDRVHNLSSMIKPFAFNKQKSYIKEVDEHFLKMLKIARRLFPRQDRAYHAIKSELNLLAITITDCYEVAEFKIANPTENGFE